jgi:multisubunit Na+/H+ antiporter MnhG subunit
MSEVWLPGAQYTNASYLMTALTQPFSYAVSQLTPIGGVTFLYASFSLLTMSYTYLHFKSALAGGVVALTLAAIGIMVPEVAQVAWFLTALGLISIVYKVIRWVVG